MVGMRPGALYIFQSSAIAGLVSLIAIQVTHRITSETDRLIACDL